MKKLLITSSVLLLFNQSLQAQVIISLEDKGYRLSNDYVTKNYELMRADLDKAELVKHITRYNPKINPTLARDIAYNILKASQCFMIDPWILTGLIKKESSFQKDAISPTGASGLTQFTGIGFKEVNDQLGFRGKTGATESAIDYFNERITQCADTNWIQLWDRVGVNEEQPEFYDLLKAEVKDDIKASIIYGAILLKTYVAFVDSRATATGAPLPLSEVYFQALQIYNGEEGDRKVRYAKAVFQNLIDLYPKEVNFPFLIDNP